MAMIDEHTITVTIKSKAEVFNNQGDPEFELKVESPFFQSQFPTTIYTPRDIDLRSPVAMVLRAVLKGGKSGSKPYDYNYRFVRLADAPPAAEPGTQPAPAPVHVGSEPEITPSPETPTDHLAVPTIHKAADKYSGAGLTFSEWHTSRRTALMQAREWLQGSTGDDGLVLDIADTWFKWLRGVPVEQIAKDPEEPPDDLPKQPVDPEDLPF